jgi:two-component system chemotaxis response regulator CheB
MDIHMPEMDGFEATRQIMAETPRPIVLVSASFVKNERDLTFNALKSGALSVLEKPTMVDPPERHELLISQLKLMSEVKVVRRWLEPAKPAAAGRPALPGSGLRAGNGGSKFQVVAIASSTGGPGVLAQILGQLPADFPLPILIVQHITRGFSAGLAGWLNNQSVLNVRLAGQGDELQPGQVLIAPDDHQMAVNSAGLISLHKEVSCPRLCPSADHLFKSVARVYGAAAIGVILTGMGADGAEGMQMMRQAGARTIAQDKESCVVFGMPAVAIELGAAEQILPVNKIAAAIIRML